MINHPTHIFSKRLASGLRLHHYHRRGGEVLGLAVVLPVGSQSEAPNEMGISHLLEHMLFCGTQEWTETQLRAEVDRRGASVNGATGPEVTAYYIVLRTDEAEFGLKYLRQLVFAPTLPPDVLAREKQIIANEASGQERGQAMEQLRSWLIDRDFLPSLLDESIERRRFKGTGYERSPIGNLRSRRAITIERLRSYYAEHYQPQQAVLLVVGGIDPEKFLTLVEAQFADLASGAAPERGLKPLPVSPGFRGVCRMMTPAVDLHVITGLSLGPAREVDLADLELLLALIDDELTDRLRTQLGLTYGVKTGGSLYREGGLLIINVTANHRHIRQVEHEMTSILDRLWRGDIEPERFRRVHQASIGRQSLRLESTERALSWLCFLPQIFSDRPPPFLADAFLEVTLEDVKQMAHPVLDPANRVRVVHLPSRLWMTGVWFISLCVLVLCILAVLMGAQIVGLYLNHWFGIPVLNIVKFS